MSLEKIVNYLQELENWKWSTVIILAGLPFLLLAKRLLNKFLASFQEKATPYMEASGQQAAKILFSVLSRLLNFRFASEYRQYLQGVYNDYQVHNLKTHCPFIFNLEKVFIPLRFVPESPEQISSNILKQTKTEIGFTIWNLLATKSEHSNYRCSAIIGPPGSGKTTLLRHLAFVYAKNIERHYHSKAPHFLPILLPLREYYEDICTQPDFELGDLIQKTISKRLKPAAGWFEIQLLNDLPAKAGRLLGA